MCRYTTNILYIIQKRTPKFMTLDVENPLDNVSLIIGSIYLLGTHETITTTKFEKMDNFSVIFI